MRACRQFGRLRYLLTGRFLQALRALALGLFSRVGPPEEIQAEAQALAEEMLSVPALALQLAKEGLTHALDANGLEAAMALEDRQQALCTRSAAFQRCIRALLASRSG